MVGCAGCELASGRHRSYPVALNAIECEDSTTPPLSPWTHGQIRRTAQPLHSEQAIETRGVFSRARWPRLAYADGLARQRAVD